MIQSAARNGGVKCVMSLNFSSLAKLFIINCVIQKSKETGIIQIKMEIRKTATVLHICPSQMGLSGLSQ